MAYFVRQLNEQGDFELIDEEFVALYPHVDFSQLKKLTDKQYQTYLNKSNGREKFIDGKFVYEEIKVDKQAVLSAEKSAKLAAINAAAQKFVSDLAKIDDTPEFERETWSIQREEAKAWHADNQAETPTLALIAQMRGVPLDVLRQKAYEKAIAYQTVAAVIAGQRQAYEDRLNAAETLEQVQAIEPVYQLPTTSSAEAGSE